MKISGVPTFCLLVLVLQFLVWNAKCDVYLQNPRGSNNRLHGQNQNRQNGNRVFDSQNNNKGGYNVGERYNKFYELNHQGSVKGRRWRRPSENNWYNMAYYMSGPIVNNKALKNTGKSLLKIEWTNQHGCGDGDLNCNLVLQYKCQAGSNDQRPMRNGASVATPQYSHRREFTSRGAKDSTRRRDERDDRVLNEPWEWYDKCTRRNRNKGLFTADQKLRYQSSKYTRQNRNGQRRGYECPEERDYYPYWHPTDWTDIAVLVNDIKDCPYYISKSFNVEPKGECMEKYSDGTWKHASVHNNQEDCSKNGGRWQKFSRDLTQLTQYTTEAQCMKAKGTTNLPLIWGVPYSSDDIDNLDRDPEKWEKCLVAPGPPDCKLAPHSRPNHLGNGKNVEALSYDWVLPYIPDSTNKKELHHRCVLRLRYNISTNDYNTSDTFSESNEVKASWNKVVKESPVVNNPVAVVEVDNKAVELQLAINTAQFGRTFQDRSHIFHIRPRPDTIKQRTIYNLNTRGKRGNIVQVYPAVEYDFVPKRLTIYQDDLVHFQWTGSDHNPRGNAGEGRAQTDRSNIVQMANPDVSYPFESPTMFKNAKVFFPLSDTRKSAEDITLAMATAGEFRYTNDFEQFITRFHKPGRREYEQLAKLDYYPPSFAGMLMSFQRGTYYYMCTRNNNFSNRSQKSRLTVR